MSQSRHQSKKLCAQKFCKNNLTKKAKKTFPKVCKAISILVKGLGSKKHYNMEKCAKGMEKNVQEMCEKTNCNPSCKDVPNLDIKDIKDGFNKKMKPAMKKVLKSVGAESGCYTTEQLKRINVTMKHLKAIIKKSKKSKSKKSKK